ncbi:glycosyltransferase family 4 protein [Jejudonia soesokkakensis]|uniref:Glycosyltransferase family 4 protein n=1 Tax=Jejudonia soesokkakensis TaxID=1323432 RepID=A0ABW2MTK5_9FLAO
MRVLQVHNKYQFEGGEDTVVQNEYNLLKSQGMTVEQLFFENKAINPLQLIHNNESAAMLRKKVTDFKPDVIHVHNVFYTATPSVLYEAKNLGIPVVMTLHNYRLICPNALFLREGNICTKCLGKSFSYPAIQHRCFKDSAVKSAALTGSLYTHHVKNSWDKNVAKFIVLTPFAKKLFIDSTVKISSEKIVVKPNSTDSNEGDVISSEKRKGYLFVGRLSEEKGVTTLIEGFNKLPDISLEVIGEGPLAEALQKNANSNIRFLGKQPFSVVKEKLRHGKALVFSSLIYEGLPNTIIEAFAAGTPVIASNVDNINTIVSDHQNGRLFTTGASEALAQTVSDFDRNNSNELYANALQTFQMNYTHDQNFKALIQLYNEVTSKQ